MSQMTRQQIDRKISQLIGKVARNTATDTDMSELHTLQRMRVQSMLPRRIRRR